MGGVDADKQGSPVECVRAMDGVGHVTHGTLKMRDRRLSRGGTRGPSLRFDPHLDAAQIGFLAVGNLL